MSLKVLPENIAKDTKECASRASWHCAKVRKRSRGDADAEKVGFEKHADSFKKEADGLLSNSTCDEIKWMFWNAEWHTANTRVGYHSDASSDKERMEQHFRNIIRAGEITEQLCSDIKWMGWNAAWLAANKMSGYNDDAKRNEAKFEAHFEKIVGEINLVAMNFFTNKAKPLAEKPKVIAEQTLINNSDAEQTMAFKFSVTMGKTTSVSTQIGFTFGVKQSVEANFFGVGGGSFEVNFSIITNKHLSAINELWHNQSL